MRQHSRLRCGTGNKQCKFRQNIKWFGLKNCSIDKMRLKCLLHLSMAPRLSIKSIWKTQLSMYLKTHLFIKFVYFSSQRKTNFSKANCPCQKLTSSHFSSLIVNICSKITPLTQTNDQDDSKPRAENKIIVWIYLIIYIIL